MDIHVKLHNTEVYIKSVINMGTRLSNRHLLKHRYTPLLRVSNSTVQLRDCLPVLTGLTGQFSS